MQKAKSTFCSRSSLWKLYNFLLRLCCKPHSIILYSSWPSLPFFTHCKKNGAKKSCVTSWVTFSSIINLRIVSATCSNSVSVGAYVQQKDNLNQLTLQRNWTNAKCFYRIYWENKKEKQLPSTSKKSNFEKTRATELVERIAIINKSKHQTEFLQSINGFVVGFGNLDGDFVPLRIRDSNHLVSKAKITQWVLQLMGGACSDIESFIVYPKHQSGDGWFSVWVFLSVYL